MQGLANLGYKPLGCAPASDTVRDVRNVISCFHNGRHWQQQMVVLFKMFRESLKDGFPILIASVYIKYVQQNRRIDKNNRTH